MPYLDTSVVVAYYVPEPLSDHVQELYEAHPSLTISELVEVEVFAALSLRIRIEDLDRPQADRVVRLFTNHVESGLYNRVHLHAGHYRVARDHIGRFDLPLKAPDGLHLAVAAAGDLRLVTADQQLARNAENLGIEAELIRP